ncbi:MAG: hypothetical protein O7J95_12895 [Planctomycetota bacterium]|nr:hypothetical protein [Planctomycetota bacterium]
MAWIALFLLLAAVVTLVVVIVVAIAFPRARPVILTLLGVGAVGVVLLGGACLLLYWSRVEVEYREPRARLRFENARDHRVAVRVSDGTAKEATPVHERVDVVVTVDGERPPPVRSSSSRAGEAVDRAPPAPRPYYPSRFLEPDGVKRLEAPDDRLVWEKESRFKWRSTTKPPDWLTTRSDDLRMIDAVGDTEFVYWNPGESQSLLGYSDQKIAGSSQRVARGEAVEEARRRAQEKLAVLGLRELKKRQKELDVTRLVKLARHLAATRFTEQQQLHLQRTHLPVSNYLAFRAAVEIKADEETVGKLAAHIADEDARGWLVAQERRWSLFLLVGGGAIAAFVIFLIYGIFNASTKGHFAWPLRFVSLCVLCAVGVAVYTIWKHTLVG